MTAEIRDLLSEWGGGEGPGEGGIPYMTLEPVSLGADSGAFHRLPAQPPQAPAVDPSLIRLIEDQRNPIKQLRSKAFQRPL